VTVPFDDRRTRRASTAAALRERLAPGDLVVYCPDQLARPSDRLLRRGPTRQVFPSGERPERIDWVDYGRTQRGRPTRSARGPASARRPGAVWLVLAGGLPHLRRQL
jgi:hypothetical protein